MREEGQRRARLQGARGAAHGASAAFIAAGIKPGDRIAIWAPNGALWIIAALGGLGAGAVIVPLDTRLKGKEAAFILRRSGARLLLTVGEFLGTRYPQLLADEALPQLERLVLFGAPAPGASARHSSSWDEFLAGGGAVSAAAVRAAYERVAPEDVADILFTSGTTGEPKGVLSTHRQNVHVFRTWSEVVGLGRGTATWG